MASSARIDELRKKFEENPRRYFAPLANEYRKSGQIEEAISICREYLPQQPGHMSGHIVYGQALYEARQFEESKTVFETALSLDPENLIALRHLGDIALILGDAEGARTWYRRVLEADPRNEEIQAQLAALDQAASTAPTPAITPAIPADKPATSSAPTVVMKAIPTPAAPPAAAPPAPAAPAARPAPVTATSPTTEIRLDEIAPAPMAPAPARQAEPTLEIATTSVAEPTAGSSPAHSANAPSAALEGLESTSAAVSAEAPAVGGFSLDGLETTSLSASMAPTPPPTSALPDLDFGPAATPPSAPTEPPAAAQAVPHLEFETPPAPPAPASAPTPAAAAVRTLELEIPASVPETLDLDFGSVTAAPQGSAASAPPAPPVSPVAQQPVATAADDEGPLDLELSLPSAPVAPIAPVSAPQQTASAPALPVQKVETEPPAPAPESGPFVTETMAELYLQQGHRNDALRVYRALAEQRPGDMALKQKVARLEADQAAPVAEIPAARPQAASAGTDLTMRELLSLIALRRPGYRAEISQGNGAAVHEAPAAESQTAGAAADSLGTQFGFNPPSPADERAATALAVAFASNGHSTGGATITGAPARPASSELSLDAVFKTEAAPPPPSNFSFDQFFSQRATAEHSAGGAAGTSAAESPAEIAQFTQWLEGLKRR